MSEHTSGLGKNLSAAGNLGGLAGSNLGSATAGLHMVPGKSEHDTAIELRESVRGRLIEIVSLMDQANRDGLRVEFQLGIDGYGRNVITRLVMIKEIG